MLNEALAAGRVTVDEVKAYLANDARLNEQIDLFSDDLELVPPEELVTWVMLVSSVMTPEDLLLLSEIVDMASRVELPPTAPSALRSSQSAPVLQLASQSATNDDTAHHWRTLLSDVRDLVTEARGGTPVAESATTLETPSSPVSRRITKIQHGLGELKRRGVPASVALHSMARDPELGNLLLQASQDKLQEAGLESQFTTMSISISPPPGVIIDALFHYDAAGNLVTLETPEATRVYEYGPDNRLRRADSAHFGYDHVGRRVYKSKPTLFQNQVSTLHEFFGFDQGANLLSWSRQNLVRADVGEEELEEYVYVAGERVAKLVTKRYIGSTDNPGGGGGGGCCCATTAIAYDGKPYCDLAAFHALQVFRGFRNTVLSGSALGEAAIRFYYRDLSPVAVAVFMEYPELRHAMNYVLRGTAWLLEFWVTPASAATTLPSTLTVYWYHNDHLGTPLALSGENGELVAEWVRDPFGNVVSKTGDVEDNHMFPGQFWDADAHLAYNWNRWYAPEVGRYIEVDPLQFGVKRQNLGGLRARIPPLEKTAWVNPFSYSINNPLTFSDPFGLSAKFSQTYQNYWVIDCYCPDNADGTKSKQNVQWSAEGDLLGITTVVPTSANIDCKDCNGVFLGVGECYISCLCW